MSNLYRGPPHRCILPSFGSFGKAVSGEKIFKNQQYLYRDNCILNTDIYIQTRVIFLSAEEKIFQKSTNQKQELPVVTDQDKSAILIEDLPYRWFLPRFGSLGQAVSEEKIFRNRPIRNKNGLQRPCLLMNRDEMNNLYRGPSIDASYQVSVHFAKRFQRRRFLKISNICIEITAF